MSSDQREHARVSFQQQIRLDLDDDSLRVFTINLSCGGLSFSSAEPVRAGLPVTAQLRVGERDFRLRGSVRHCTQVMSEVSGVERSLSFVVGIEFAELPPAERAALEQAIGVLRAFLDD